MAQFDDIQADSLKIGDTEIGERELELLKHLASNLVTAKIQANSVKIGDTEIGEHELKILERLSERELDILKRLANSELKVAIKSRQDYYLDNYGAKKNQGDWDRTIQFREGYDQQCQMTLEIL